MSELLTAAALAALYAAVWRSAVLKGRRARAEAARLTRRSHRPIGQIVRVLGDVDAGLHAAGLLRSDESLVLVGSAEYVEAF